MAGSMGSSVWISSLAQGGEGIELNRQEQADDHQVEIEQSLKQHGPQHGKEQIKAGKQGAVVCIPSPDDVQYRHGVAGVPAQQSKTLDNGQHGLQGG